MNDALTIPTKPRNSRRRDAVTWVLSAVTATVLLVGVLVVRSTRSEPSPVVSDPSRQGPPLIEEVSQPKRPRVIVALPEPTTPK